MSHKFFKTASKGDQAPGRVSDESYEKLKKFAHDIWSMSDDDGVSVLRRDAADEEGEESEEGEEGEMELELPEELLGGEMVILVLGGRSYKASVITARQDDVDVSIDGLRVEKVPRNMVRKALGFDPGVGPQENEDMGQFKTRPTRPDAPGMSLSAPPVKARPPPQMQAPLDPGMGLPADTTQHGQFRTRPTRPEAGKPALAPPPGKVRPPPGK